MSGYLEAAELQEDIQWRVLEPYKVNGGIYMLMPHFGIWGLAISPEDADGMGEWNLEAFFSLIEKNNGEKRIFLSSTPSAVLEAALWGMRDTFIDWETMQADFDSHAFRQLLYFCREYGKEDYMKPGEGYDTSELAEHILFLDVPISTPAEYIDLLKAYGRNAKVYGFPTKDGQQYLVNGEKDACSIYAGSRNKEGAWAFLETLLEPSFQGRGHGMPLCRSIYKEQWEKATREKITVNNTTTELLESEAAIMDAILEEGRFFSGAQGMQWWEVQKVVLEEAEVYFQGGKELAEVTEIIQNRVQLMLDE